MNKEEYTIKLDMIATFEDKQIRVEDLLKQLFDENKQLKDNWNKLRDYLSENITAYGYRTRVRWISPQSIMSKMFELEKGDDNEG